MDQLDNAAHQCVFGSLPQSRCAKHRIDVGRDICDQSGDKPRPDLLQGCGFRKLQSALTAWADMRALWRHRSTRATPDQPGFGCCQIVLRVLSVFQTVNLQIELSVRIVTIKSAAKAQNAGPSSTRARPETLTSATATPMIKISAIAQGLSRSAHV